MKKILLLVLTLGLIGTSQAQFGARVGLTSSNFHETNFKARMGFHVGGYYTLDAGFVAVEPGVQFSQRGYKTTNGVTGADVSERMNYIDIPVLVRLNLLPIVNVFVGPQGSLLLSRKYDEGGNVQTSTEPIRGYDISGVVGVGVKLPAGINAQLSYDIGFTSLNYYNQDTNNRALKLSLGIDF